MKTVFLSSTFRDMYAERDVLNERTIPALDREARMYGDSVSACDLRWGIDTSDMEREETNRKIFEVCFDEIDRSSNPMVVLIGERYGWIPPLESVREMARRRGLHLKDEEKSATELEIEYGIRKRGHIGLFYLRNAVGDVPRSHRPEDDLHRFKLSELKRRIETFPGCIIRPFTVRYRDGIPYGEDLRRFGEMVQRDLRQIFASDWNSKASEAPVEREMDVHRLFVREKASYYRAKPDELESALSAIEHGDRLLILKGATGSGKSTLFGKLALELERLGWNAIPLSCGMTTMSTSTDSLLRFLVRYLEHIQGSAGSSAGKVDGAKLNIVAERYVALCSDLAKSGKRHIIMIDAVDQLQADAYRNQLPFVPKQALGDNLRFIMTCLPDNDTRRIDENATTLQVKALGWEDRRRVIDGILSVHHKELPAAVINALMAHKGNETPLYFSLMIQRLLLMGVSDFEKVNALGGGIANIVKRQIQIIEKSPDSLDALGVMLLDEAANRFDANLIETSMGYLGTSRRGLRTADLARLCPDNWSYVDFSLVFSYLRDSFFEREDGRVDFAHRCFRRGISEYSVRDPATVNRRILVMLSSLDSDDPVKRSEYLYHCVQANDREAFCSYVRDCEGSEDEKPRNQAAESLHDLCISNMHWICNSIMSVDHASLEFTLISFFVYSVQPLFTDDHEQGQCLLAILLVIESRLHTYDDAAFSTRLPRLKLDLYREISRLQWVDDMGRRHSGKPGTSDPRYAMEYYRQARILYGKGMLTKEEFFDSCYETIIFLKDSHDDEALSIALRIAEEGIQDSLLDAASFSMAGLYFGAMGELYGRRGDGNRWRESYQRSLEYARRADAEKPDANTKMSLASGWQNVGHIMAGQGKSQEALDCFKSSVKAFDECIADDSNVTKSILQLGMSYIQSVVDQCLTSYLSNYSNASPLIDAFDYTLKSIFLNRRLQYLFGGDDIGIQQYRQLYGIIERLEQLSFSRAKSLVSRTINQFNDVIDFDVTQFRISRSDKSELALRASILGAMRILRRFDTNATYATTIEQVYKTEILEYHNSMILSSREARNTSDLYHALVNKATALLDLDEYKYFDEVLFLLEDAHSTISKSTGAYGSFPLTDGAIYKGLYSDWELKDRPPIKEFSDGFHRCVFLDGSFYEGYWLNGYMSGEGKMAYANGDEYKGNWIMGTYEGNGVLTLSGGKGSYRGNWSNGRRCGYGKAILVDGTQYEGEWLDDEYDGYGLLSKPGEKTTCGIWSQGQLREKKMPFTVKRKLRELHPKRY